MRAVVQRGRHLCSQLTNSQIRGLAAVKFADELRARSAAFKDPSKSRFVDNRGPVVLTVCGMRCGQESTMRGLKKRRHPRFWEPYLVFNSTGRMDIW